MQGSGNSLNERSQELDDVCTSDRDATAVCCPNLRSQSFGPFTLFEILFWRAGFGAKVNGQNVEELRDWWVSLPWRPVGSP